MLRLRYFFSFLAVFLSLFMSTNALARVSVIVSIPPAEQEIIMPPQGFERCYIVPGSFYRGIWIHRHRECYYENAPYGDIWVSGFWRCVRYRGIDGVCLDWDWVPSHWMRRGYRPYREGYVPRGNYAPPYYYRGEGLYRQ